MTTRPQGRAERARPIPAGVPRKLGAMPGAVKIVLVEDNQIFRETLELLLGLRGDLEIVGSVGTGQEAVDVCADLHPDVVVVDYRMPGLSGAQTTEAVLKVSPATRVVCLTASVSKRRGARALRRRRGHLRRQGRGARAHRRGDPRAAELRATG